jgi:hypothetical protein
MQEILPKWNPVLLIMGILVRIDEREVFMKVEKKREKEYVSKRIKNLKNIYTI